MVQALMAHPDYRNKIKFFRGFFSEAETGRVTYSMPLMVGAWMNPASERHFWRAEGVF
jgi:hypothetical protein